MQRLSNTSIFPYIFCNFDTVIIPENVWENQDSLKTDHGLLCTPDLPYCFFELVSLVSLNSFQRESIKYKLNSGRNSRLWINTNLLISRHLALITHDATMSVNSSIRVKYGSIIFKSGVGWRSSIGKGLFFSSWKDIHTHCIGVK